MQIYQFSEKQILYQGHWLPGVETPYAYKNKIQMCDVIMTL